MAILSVMEPSSVLSFFEDICSIPHPSYHESKLTDYLEKFAKDRGLEYYRDQLDNIIMIKPATPGYEQEPAMILQGHQDMVCEQVAGRNIDFENEGLDLFVENGWIGARGTTLGGDDGIAVAYGLALLDSKDIPHPRLEVVLTVSEETGMEGACGIDLSVLQGRRMLNLDSEEEGQILTSCAGGCRLDCRLGIDRQQVQGELCTISLHGLMGGHSGAEIHQNRANANKVLARVLIELGSQFSYSLVSMSGGTKDNAIPREAEAKIVVAARMLPMLSAALERAKQGLKADYSATDPDLMLELHPEGEGCQMALSYDSAQKALLLIQCLPNGVQKMSEDMPGLVETSLNMGILALEEDALHIRFSIRSSVGAAKEQLKRELAQAISAVGGTVAFGGDYPAWEYRKDSPLRDDLCQIYREMYGKEAQVLAIHAGLECGLLMEKLPGLDAVSIGPNMRNIHSPQERLEIASVARTWDFICGILAKKHS